MVRGWQFMKEFVHEDGRVFHKGKEQIHLKGTLPPTPKQSSKNKLTKIEKQQLKNIGAIRGNYDVNMNNLQFQREGLKYEADNAYYSALSRINSMPGAFGQSPTANALQYATAGLDAGTTYYKLGGRFDDKKYQTRGKPSNQFDHR